MPAAAGAPSPHPSGARDKRGRVLDGMPAVGCGEVAAGARPPWPQKAVLGGSWATSVPRRRRIFSICHDGHLVLSRHVLAAVVKRRPRGDVIAKDRRRSPR
jgi:hypothetical protein